jgi:hypothetical protein
MGIEIAAEHGGAESSFTSAILTIEELAKVDPSVSVMCDVHNTLVNTVVRKYGTKEQQDKFLPLLAQSQVCFAWHLPRQEVNSGFSSGLFVCPKLLAAATRLLCRRVRRRMATTGS